MALQDPDILIPDRKIEPRELRRLAQASFHDMVKLVVDVRRRLVDVRRRLVGVGGELHADAEQLLLEDGSRQADLWGANIRPAEGNRSMEIADDALRRTIREITFALIGRGEEA